MGMQINTTTQPGIESAAETKFKWKAINPLIRLDAYALQSHVGQ